MTLAEIIGRYEQRQAARSSSAPAIEYVPAAVALTPRGDVTIAIRRLEQQLRALDHEDRQHALEQLSDMLLVLDPTPVMA